MVEIYTIITTFLIISYKITITCLICDGNSHTLNFQTILHVVTVQVISSICLKMYLIFNISIHNFKISALFVLIYYFLIEIYKILFKLLNFGGNIHNYYNFSYHFIQDYYNLFDL